MMLTKVQVEALSEGKFDAIPGLYVDKAVDAIQIQLMAQIVLSLRSVRDAVLMMKK